MFALNMNPTTASGPPPFNKGGSQHMSYNILKSLFSLFSNVLSLEMFATLQASLVKGGGGIHREVRTKESFAHKREDNILPYRRLNIVPIPTQIYL